MISKAVTAYWQSTQPIINQSKQLHLFSNALLEAESYYDNTAESSTTATVPTEFSATTSKSPATDTATTTATGELSSTIATTEMIATTGAEKPFSIPTTTPNTPSTLFKKISLSVRTAVAWLH